MVLFINGNNITDFGNTRFIEIKKTLIPSVVLNEFLFFRHFVFQILWY